MTCDIVIVIYESATLLGDCIASIPPGHRVIVVDNASTDGSADLAESLGCEVLRNTTNTGFGRAVNRAMREQVKNDRVLLLNPDARLDPTTIDALHAAVSQPGVAVAGPRLVGLDGTPQRPWWSFPSPRRAWLEAAGLHRLRPVDFDESRDVDFVVGACLMVRTEAWHEAGGFDERYWLYGEEADLCRRLGDLGWRVRYVPEVRAIHVGGASGESIGITVAEHFHRRCQSGSYSPTKEWAR